MHSALSWRSYEGPAESTVVGDVRISDPLAVDYLDIERELLVWLPPSYEETDRQFPVVYMHDGQNCFDEATSNDGEWEVDETMTRLAETGLEAIVVAIPNAEEARMVEYSPFIDFEGFEDEAVDARMGEFDPAGQAYAAFLAETVKPLIDESFRTTDDRAKTALVGSSLGGLISVYAFFTYPEVFGCCGAMSPATGGPWHEIFDYIESVGHVDGRVHVDVGGEEFPDNSERSEQFREGANELVARLEAMGYDENLRFVYEEDAVHHEAAWARRFPDAIRFLLAQS